MHPVLNGGPKYLYVYALNLCANHRKFSYTFGVSCVTAFSNDSMILAVQRAVRNCGINGFHIVG